MLRPPSKKLSIDTQAPDSSSSDTGAELVTSEHKHTVSDSIHSSAMLTPPAGRSKTPVTIERKEWVSTGDPGEIEVNLEFLPKGLLVLRDSPHIDVTPSSGHFNYAGQRFQFFHLPELSLAERERKRKREETRARLEGSAVDHKQEDERSKDSVKKKVELVLPPAAENAETILSTPLKSPESRAERETRKVMERDQRIKTSRAKQEGIRKKREAAKLARGAITSTSAAAVAEETKQPLIDTDKKRTEKVPVTSENPKRKKRDEIKDLGHPPIPGLRDGENISLYNKLLHLDNYAEVKSTYQSVLSIFFPDCPDSLDSHERNRAAIRKAIEDYAAPYVPYSRKVGRIDPTSVIVSFGHRDSTFIPRYLRVNGQPSLLYIHHWLSNGTVGDLYMQRCQRGVTAMCYLAGALFGVCERGQKVLFIKHEINLYPGQKFDSIHFERQSQIYQLEALDIFEHQLEMLKENSATEMYVHLPVLDYPLIAVQLYLQDRITLKALNDVFWRMLSEGELVTQKLAALGRKHGIAVIVGSPFKTLFENIHAQLSRELLLKRKGNYAITILKELGVIEVSSSGKFVRNMPGTEHDFVKLWLAKMLHSKSDSTHKIVWHWAVNARDAKLYKSITNVEGDTLPNSLTNIDQLFKLANGLWVLMSTYGLPDFAVFNMQDITERPIQHTHAKLVAFERAQLTSSHASLEEKELDPLPEHGYRFPITVNYTIMSRVQSHNLYNEGKLFYQPNFPEPHAKVHSFFKRELPHILKGERTEEALLGTFSSPLSPKGMA